VTIFILLLHASLLFAPYQVSRWLRNGQMKDIKNHLGVSLWLEKLAEWIILDSDSPFSDV
jgi:hypothetical protein